MAIAIVDFREAVHLVERMKETFFRPMMTLTAIVVTASRRFRTIFDRELVDDGKFRFLVPAAVVDGYNTVDGSSKKNSGSQ